MHSQFTFVSHESHLKAFLYCIKHFCIQKTITKLLYMSTDVLEILYISSIIPAAAAAAKQEGLWPILILIDMDSTCPQPNQVRISGIG